MFHPKPVHFAFELVTELFEQFLSQELLLNRFEHAGFDFVAADCQQVVAAPLIACAETGEPIAASHDESRAADAAR
jgi:hypothetical protein